MVLWAKGRLHLANRRISESSIFTSDYTATHFSFVWTSFSYGSFGVFTRWCLVTIRCWDDEVMYYEQGTRGNQDWLHLNARGETQSWVPIRFFLFSFLLTPRFCVLKHNFLLFYLLLLPRHWVYGFKKNGFYLFVWSFSFLFLASFSITDWNIALQTFFFPFICPFWSTSALYGS